MNILALTLLLSPILVSTQQHNHQPASLTQSLRRRAQTTTISLGPYFNVGDGVITDIQSIPGDSSRLFVVTRNGRIHIVRNFATDDGSPMTKDSTPFLDVSGRGYNGGERGLLGLAFDPNYSTNGYFYINYSDNNSDNRISRFTVSGNANVADPNSELILETILQDYNNHNGGQLQFHSGYLYAGMGDGGSAGDPQNRALNPDSLLGKMLRFQVSNGLSGNDYQFEWTAAGSPNLPGPPGTFNETIWSYGLRNPWRFSFDRDTDDLVVADVGQDAWEEVTWLGAGGSGGENYGWKYCEGFNRYSFSGNPVSDSHCSGSSSSPDLPNYVAPAFTYGHGTGQSITGGYVYRGKDYSAFDGVYFYGDYVSRFIRGATPNIPNDWSGGVNPSFLQFSLPSGYAPTTFGEDSDGEIYVGFGNSRMAKIRGPATVSTPAPTISLAPSESPTVYPTRAPFSIAVACPPSLENTRSLESGLTLHYSIVPDPSGDASSYGGLFCAELVHDDGTANSQWLGLGVSACPPVDINNGDCNKMDDAEVVIGDPSDSSVTKYKLYIFGANRMPGPTLLNATIDVVGTVTTLKFTKYLKESNEIEIDADGENLFIYAVGLDNESFPNTHGSRGAFILDHTPTTSPTKAPTRNPTVSPIPVPTSSPTKRPTGVPTSSPIPNPTKNPTTSPTPVPTSSPTTEQPTASPTKSPTTSPVQLPLTVLAEYDFTMTAPRCDIAGSECDTGTSLIRGRASISGGNEPNSPNTMGSCNDGLSGAYQTDESIDRVFIRSVSEERFRIGSTIIIDATVFPWRDGSDDFADFFYATNANNPNWINVGRRTNIGTGFRTVSSDPFVLQGDSAVHAVRVVFRYSTSSNPSITSCPGGQYDDVDDIVFTVLPDVTTSPTKSPTPAPLPPTVSPTPEPTSSPTTPPTPNPTSSPTPAPTSAPTKSPTPSPTKSPTTSPTPNPTSSPTPAPTQQPIPPTLPPTKQPTSSPTPTPTPAPIAAPTCAGNGDPCSTDSDCCSDNCRYYWWTQTYSCSSGGWGGWGS